LKPKTDGGSSRIWVQSKRQILEVAYYLVRISACQTPPAILIPFPAIGMRHGRAGKVRVSPVVERTGKNLLPANWKDCV
jgi:hypothetical protein